jgi:hypothetical protein
MEQSGKMEIRKEINIEISDEKDTYFLASFIKENSALSKSSVEGVYIYDINQTEVISDESFSTAKQFLEWTTDLIQKLKIIESEVKKLIQEDSTKSSKKLKNE